MASSVARIRKAKAPRIPYRSALRWSLPGEAEHQNREDERVVGTEQSFEEDEQRQSSENRLRERPSDSGPTLTRLVSRSIFGFRTQGSQARARRNVKI